jgi:hypothetical protein
VAFLQKLMAFFVVNSSMVFSSCDSFSQDANVDLRTAREIVSECDMVGGKSPEARQLGLVVAIPSAVCFVGSIRQHNIDKLLEIGLPSNGWLYVNSDGGNVSLALDIAEILISKKVNIIVDGFCVSSCANYWFLAAEKKFVMENSYVAFHGVPRARSNPGWSDWDYQNYLDMVKRSEEFFVRLGVNHRIASQSPQNWTKKDNSSSVRFWTWSRREMEEQFHVKGIVFYWSKN